MSPYVSHGFTNMCSPSINTDYEKYWPAGIKREYWLNVSGQAISPDGFLKPLGKVLNNTYPGPLIEACWGDDIVRTISMRTCHVPKPVMVARSIYLARCPEI